MSVSFFLNVSLVFGVARVGRNTSTIRFLGSPPSAAACADVCAAEPTRCWMFSFYPPSSPSKLAGGCYGLTDPSWSPVPEDATVSGSIDYPCRNDADCSFNGACATNGTCDCTHAWRGSRCEVLNLLPATRSAGFSPVDDGEPTTTWGGNVVECAAGFCMFASEITRHCGIAAWGQNSRVVMATSLDAGGVFTRAASPNWPVFSHEPAAVMAPSGEIALYYTASPRNASCTCVNGSTAPGDCNGAELGDGVSAPTLLSFAPSVNGPWSEPQTLFADYKGADLNFSPIIFANGSVHALWRRWSGGSHVFLAHATDWRNASSYTMERAELFPDVGAGGVEDMFLYQDPQGRFHAIFHHMFGVNSTTSWWLVAAGAHAFSENGFDWTFGGVAWGNTTTQGYDIRYTDGTTFHYTRLERPAFAFGADGLPSILYNAAQYGTGRSATGTSGGDGAETIAQPIG